jgi:hypothetical protein
MGYPSLWHSDARSFLLPEQTKAIRKIPKSAPQKTPAKNTKGSIDVILLPHISFPLLSGIPLYPFTIGPVNDH